MLRKLSNLVDAIVELPDAIHAVVGLAREALDVHADMAAPDEFLSPSLYQANQQVEMLTVELNAKDAELSSAKARIVALESDAEVDANIQRGLTKELDALRHSNNSAQSQLSTLLDVAEERDAMRETLATQEKELASLREFARDRSVDELPVGVPDDTRLLWSDGAGTGIWGCNARELRSFIGVAFWRYANLEDVPEVTNAKG